MPKILLFKKIALFVVLILFSALFMRANAAGGLDNARDTINTNLPNGIATHDIRFTLPVSATPVSADDYIFINMTSFSDLTEPTQILGDYSGTPIVSIISTFIRITGISFAPGATINLYGITAINPTEPGDFVIFIRIAEDPDSLNVRNEAGVLAKITTGSVSISAYLEAEIGVLRIIGYGSPGMFVSFAEGATPIGSTTANDIGRFAQVFPGMAETTHTITITGYDIHNRTIPPTIVEVFTKAYELTTVSDIILPPTIELSTNQISPGETIEIFGRGTPDYKTMIFTEPPLNSFEVDVDEFGEYQYTFSDTENLELGDHRIYALLQNLIGSQSLFSNTLFFRVTSGQEEPGEEPVCNITRGDINCDESVDLVDFSILLFYWGSNESLADINNDGTVNLVDFSVMMFYWQG